MVVKVGHDDVVVLGDGGVVGTGELEVFVAAGAKLVQQFAVVLEDEHGAGLVVHHDDVAVVVHRHALRALQPSRADLKQKRRYNHVEYPEGDETLLSTNGMTVVVFVNLQPSRADLKQTRRYNHAAYPKGDETLLSTNIPDLKQTRRSWRRLDRCCPRRTLGVPAAVPCPCLKDETIHSD